MCRSGVRSNESGAILVMAAIVITVLLAMSALAIDLGELYMAKQQAQNVADAASLAGAGKITGTLTTTMVAAAKQAATDVAAANTVLGKNVTLVASDIEVGGWNRSTKLWETWSASSAQPAQPAVRVTVHRVSGSADGPIPAIFSTIFGRRSSDITASAIAGPVITLRPRIPVELMVVQDASSSFQDDPNRHRYPWTAAMDANRSLFDKINEVSVQDDAVGFVAFNAALSWTSGSWLDRQSASFKAAYRAHPEINQGIKYSTDLNGYPTLVDESGNLSGSGLVRPLTLNKMAFDLQNHDSLPTTLDNALHLLNRGNAWGDTDTGAGLKFAIDQWYDDRTPKPGMNTGTKKAIIVISDGMPHSVDGSTATQALKDKANTQATRAGDLGINISTVTLEGAQGLDSAFNAGLVRGDGVALSTTDPTKLKDLLTGAAETLFGKPTLLQ